MAFADPQTITLDGSGGTAKNLVKINQDSYGSEYLLQETTSEFRMKIRHTKESVKAGANPVNRHNVEISQRVYPTEALPLGRTRTISITCRNEEGDDLAACNDLFESAPFWLTEANLTKILGWES